MLKNFKRPAAFLLALVMSLSLLATAFASDTGGAFLFSDVKSTAWYYNDVTECARLGIVSGYEDGTFRPEDKVTDVQWVAMITRTFYNSDVETAARSKPAGTPWYWANTQVAADNFLTTGMAIDGSAMNRYDMANVAKNVIQLINNGVNNPSDAARNAVPDQVKDWDSVPKNRTVAIKVCYATGVITGMTDGKFHGEQSMTRAQSCAVIIRMLKLIGSSAPGGKDNGQPDNGKDQNTGGSDQNQQTTSGTLANGQPATVANVEAILAQIKEEYPDGTIFQEKGTPNNHWYDHTCATDHDVHQLMYSANAGELNLKYGCGGFMCMVSERIFGETGAPAREVTDVSKLRPGDIVLNYDKNGEIYHAAIVERVGQNPDQGNAWRYSVCSGNATSPVRWADRNQYPAGRLGILSSGDSRRAFTRYPENGSEIESEIP